jgi:hypothetical protein
LQVNSFRVQQQAEADAAAAKLAGAHTLLEEVHSAA